MISRIVFIILFSLISLNLCAKQTAFDLSGEKINRVHRGSALSGGFIERYMR